METTPTLRNAREVPQTFKSHVKGYRHSEQAFVYKTNAYPTHGTNPQYDTKTTVRSSPWVWRSDMSLDKKKKKIDVIV